MSTEQVGGRKVREPEVAEAIIVMWGRAIDEEPCEVSSGSGDVWVEGHRSYMDCLNCDGTGVTKMPETRDLREAVDLLLADPHQGGDRE